MKWVLLVCLALVMGGCSLLGLHTDPKTGELVSDGTGGIVGQIGGTFWPWAGTLVAGAAGIFAEVKRRNWRSAAKGTVDAIEEFKKTDLGQAAWEKLKEKLVTKHGPGAQKLIDGLTKKLRKLDPPAAPSAPNAPKL